MSNNDIGNSVYVHVVSNYTLVAVPSEVQLEIDGEAESKQAPTRVSGPVLLCRSVANFVLAPQQTVLTVPCARGPEAHGEPRLSGEKRPCLGGERWMYRDFCAPDSDIGIGVFEFTHEPRGEEGETDSFLLHCEGAPAFVLVSFRCRVTVEVLDGNGDVSETRRIGYKEDEGFMASLLWAIHKNTPGVYVQRPQGGARVSVRLSIPSSMAGYVVYIPQDAAY